MVFEKSKCPLKTTYDSLAQINLIYASFCRSWRADSEYIYIFFDKMNPNDFDAKITL